MFTALAVTWLYNISEYYDIIQESEASPPVIEDHEALIAEYKELRQEFNDLLQKCSDKRDQIKASKGEKNALVSDLIDTENKAVETESILKSLTSRMQKAGIEIPSVAAAVHVAKTEESEEDKVQSKQTMVKMQTFVEAEVEEPKKTEKHAKDVE